MVRVVDSLADRYGKGAIRVQVSLINETKEGFPIDRGKRRNMKGKYDGVVVRFIASEVMNLHGRGLHVCEILIHNS